MTRVHLDDPHDVNAGDGFTSERPAGSFAWVFNPHEHNQRYIVLRLPCPNHPLAILPVHRPGEVPVGGKHAYWQWNGNEDTPTLSPSILHHSVPSWHGHVDAGVMVPCSDSQS